MRFNSTKLVYKKSKQTMFRFLFSTDPLFEQISFEVFSVRVVTLSYLMVFHYVVNAWMNKKCQLLTHLTSLFFCKPDLKWIGDATYCGTIFKILMTQYRLIYCDKSINFSSAWQTVFENNCQDFWTPCALRLHR